MKFSSGMRCEIQINLSYLTITALGEVYRFVANQNISNLRIRIPTPTQQEVLISLLILMKRSKTKVDLSPTSNLETQTQQW